MSQILRALLFAVLIVGCGDSPELDSSYPNTVNESSDLGSDRFYHGDLAVKTGCDQSTIRNVQINGRTYLVEIPSICKAEPVIFKGDPGPEFGNVLDNDLAIRKDILLRINTTY